jgi:hypothetical protein
MNAGFPDATTCRHEFKVLRKETAAPATVESESRWIALSRFNLWNGLEYIAVLILLGAVVASLSFCSTAFVRW